MLFSFSSPFWLFFGAQEFRVTNSLLFLPPSLPSVAAAAAAAAKQHKYDSGGAVKKDRPLFGEKIPTKRRRIKENSWPRVPPPKKQGKRKENSSPELLVAAAATVKFKTERRK